MLTSLKSPGCYMQEKDIIKELYPHISPLGNRALILISPGGRQRIGKYFSSGLEKNGFSCVYSEITAQCCSQEIDRLSAVAASEKADMVIGVGGGKILDIAKAVADTLNLSSVIIPTIASTDAPCSSLSVLYTPEGVFDRYLHTRKCPDLVIVDSQIIADSPKHFLAYGMGDALSTYFEARAVKRSGCVNQLGTMPTSAAFALAVGCYDTLLEYGNEALIAAEKHEVTPAFERVVEADIYLSGVGFESGGVAAAHALQKGITVIPALHKSSHGQIVAFATIVQLCLEKAAAEELKSVISFCKNAGLPTCFKDLSGSEISKSDWQKAAEFTCRPNMTIHKMPFKVTAEMLVDAIYEADEAGRNF